MSVYRKSKTNRQRLEEKIEMIPECGCWIWMGALGDKRYGKFWMDGKHHRANRAAWMIYRGSIPNKLDVCHHCDTPSCVNPHHLFLGTRSENIKDAFRKNRKTLPDNRGEKSGTSKLTEAQVIAIKTDIRDCDLIAYDYHIHVAHVRALKSGRYWKHLRHDNGTVLEAEKSGQVIVFTGKRAKPAVRIELTDSTHKALKSKG